MYRNSVGSGHGKSAHRASKQPHATYLINSIMESQRLLIDRQAAEIRQCRDLILELARFNIEARIELDAQARHLQQAAQRDRGAEQTCIDGRVVSVENKVPSSWQ